MTIQEKLQWFDILQDQFGSPYFTDAEKLLFLNRGQWEYVKNLFPGNEGGIINIETNSDVWENVAPLMWKLSDEVVSSTGLITYDALTTNLRSISGDATTDIFKLLKIGYKKGQKIGQVKVMRHNDEYAFVENFFKKPSAKSFRYDLENNSIKISPIDQTARIMVTVLKSPRQMALTPSVVNTDLPSSTHNEIVAYGLQFAGVASRDEVLTAMNGAQLPQ
jgi:hypothetical protein